ncbi:MAG TPA: ATP-binding protein, partial [Candidatus Eisenbacteria bacterium]|nr:ATP-binding protein [Candidatus Eisenbacteria bacterium]
SHDASAFRPAELRVAAGLASHLAAALHASQLRDQLELAISELDRTREQLVRSERLRVAGELAAGIAHEFNNVLAAILGRVQLLRTRATAGTLQTKELTDALGVMELAARDGAETVRRLRRFGSDEGSDTHDSVDLDAIIREAAEFTRPRWRNAGETGDAHIDLRVDSTAGAWVKGAPAHLREVFTNLILNAVDALPRGGHIRIGCLVQDGRVSAYVEDDGMGMGEEARARAFEPFYTTKGMDGTGLGLSMVYGIVKNHEGTIEVESQPGRGTRIAMSFAAAPPREEAPPDALAPAPPAALSVMVVDDEPSVRELLIDILGSLGVPAEGRTGGAAALEGFRPSRFDLVLTDLGMPGVDGWQVCQSMRALDQAVTIAFVTGWGEGVDLDRVRRAGAQTVVPKPFSIEDIEAVVRLAADRKLEKAA